MMMLRSPAFFKGSPLVRKEQRSGGYIKTLLENSLNNSVKRDLSVSEFKQKVDLNSNHGNRRHRGIYDQ